jgi:hypothetical protein
MHEGPVLADRPFFVGRAAVRADRSVAVTTRPVLADRSVLDVFADREQRRLGLAAVAGP